MACARRENVSAGRPGTADLADPFRIAGQGCGSPPCRVPLGKRADHPGLLECSQPRPVLAKVPGMRPVNQPGQAARIGECPGFSEKPALAPVTTLMGIRPRIIALEGVEKHLVSACPARFEPCAGPSVLRRGLMRPNEQNGFALKLQAQCGMQQKPAVDSSRNCREERLQLLESFFEELQFGVEIHSYPTPKGCAPAARSGGTRPSRSRT
jgi:hypothetical protein